MAEQLDSQLIGELLALLAHDLRNPLSALHSNLGFLRSVVGDDDPDAAEALTDSLVSCDGLGHIIDNIDLFGRALRAAHSGNGARADLGQVVAEVVRRSQPTAESHGLGLELDPAVSSLDAMVAGDSEMVARAVANLVRNSIQHSGPGSTVRVSVRPPAEGRVSVLIEDAGAPVAEELRERALTAEGQTLSKGATNGRYSRGLGLYAALLATKACGGEIRVVEPPAGAGNAFDLSLSLA